jgi:hypothetical protein
MYTDQSIKALAKFKDQLQGTKAIGEDYIGFDSTVNYRWKGNSVTENLEAKICLSGYGINRVILSQGKKINSKSLYLEFNPEYQDYTLAKNGSLVIKQSNSDKIGDYEVTIQAR